MKNTGQNSTWYCCLHKISGFAGTVDIIIWSIIGHAMRVSGGGPDSCVYKAHEYAKCRAVARVPSSITALTREFKLKMLIDIHVTNHD